MILDKVFFGVRFVGEVVHQRIGFPENHVRGMPDRIMPVAGGVERVDFKQGFINHFVKWPKDGVIQIAVQVGMDLK